MHQQLQNTVGDYELFLWWDKFGVGFFYGFFFLFYKLCGELGTVQNGANPEKFTEA